MQEVLKFLKDAKTYYLGTINDGNPSIRPFGTIHMFENKLYFQTGRIKDVYKQIKENENIYICAFIDGKWIRIDAIAVEDEREIASIDLLNEYEELKSMYKAGDGNCTVFYLKDATAKICSFTDKEKVIKF